MLKYAGESGEVTISSLKSASSKGSLTKQKHLSTLFPTIYLLEHSPIGTGTSISKCPFISICITTSHVNHMFHVMFFILVQCISHFLATIIQLTIGCLYVYVYV